MNKFLLFYEDQYMGEGLQEHPTNIHYFCRHCGRVWARILSDVKAWHSIWTGSCPNCDDENWGAPLLVETFRFNNMIYPRAAWERDFLYLMERKFGPVMPDNLPENSHEYQR